MKKTILATIVTSLFAATAAHSATVYDANGMTFEVYGDVEVQARKGISETTAKDDTAKTINIDDSDFGFKVGYDIGHGFTAIGVVEVDGENDDNKLAMDDAYVGLSSAQWGTLTAGQQVTIADDQGIGNDYEFGIDNSSESYTDGKQVVKYTLDKGNYYGGISYLVNTGAGADGNDSLDAKLGARLGDLDLTVYYGNADKGAHDSETVVLEARYAFTDLELAASASSTDNDSGVADATSFGLAAVYTVDKMAYSAAWSLVDTDGVDDVNKYFVNAAYSFNSNVTAYLEVASNDEDLEGNDSEIGYAAGMAITF
ncbi:porin [uncultured Psychromonas sp.]|uniref:porin n=1 Tax=uncultured Psychromonas sp. TaxID=173974 RepID=UPI002611EBC0|nr:porin [uncultured Psychromonas sp.]